MESKHNEHNEHYHKQKVEAGESSYSRANVVNSIERAHRDYTPIRHATPNRQFISPLDTQARPLPPSYSKNYNYHLKNNINPTIPNHTHNQTVIDHSIQNRQNRASLNNPNVNNPNNQLSPK